MFCFWIRGGIPLPKSKVLAVHIVLDSWTKVNVVRFITKKHRRGKNYSVTENKKLLSDALLDENHISPEIEENLDFILA
jgi:hypothetical protein